MITQIERFRVPYLRSQLHRVPREHVARLPDGVVHEFDVPVQNVAPHVLN